MHERKVKKEILVRKEKTETSDTKKRKKIFNVDNLSTFEIRYHLLLFKTIVKVCKIIFSNFLMIKKHI